MASEAVCVTAVGSHSLIAGKARSDSCGGHGSIDSFLPFRFVSCPMFHLHFDSQGTGYIRLWHEQNRNFLWDTDLSFTEKAAFTFAHLKKPL